SYDFNAGDIVDNELTLTAVNGTDGSSCDFSLLPVELISFVGTATREGIVLDWVTASELNNERFEIEHSSGDGKFDVIGIVDGNGTTDQEISYSFTHLGPLEGANYYRLRQFDFDGANEVSETIVTFYETTDDMSIYPNPVSDQLNIYLGQRFSRTSMNMVIRDISGKVVWNKSFNAPEQKVELTITHLKPGPYLLEVTNGTYTHVEHIIFR
ncbi:MAG: T9SS type A sorting domain-containing protein, partial [Cyclobacteriaceae bacterium]